MRHHGATPLEGRGSVREAPHAGLHEVPAHALGREPVAREVGVVVAAAVLAAAHPRLAAVLQVALHGLPVGGGDLPAPGGVELLNDADGVLNQRLVVHVHQRIATSWRRGLPLQGLPSLHKGAREVIQHAVPHLRRVHGLGREDLLLAPPQGAEGPDDLLRRSVGPDEPGLREGLPQGAQVLEVHELALEHVTPFTTPTADLRLLEK
mmetsp:Transcript_123988/g.345091  ORF Transcript_123988/g.345091 Transcript_123988/m.345091 type:complete len:207 (+) Transcript_123988:299-919(+)